MGPRGVQEMKPLIYVGSIFRNIRVGGSRTGDRCVPGCHPVAPQRPAMCTAVTLHPYGHMPEPASEQGTVGSSNYPSVASGMPSPPDTPHCPLSCNTKQQRQNHCAAVVPAPPRLPPGHMREGTAPTANGKVQGRGEPRGEAHKGLIVRQVSLGSAHTGRAVQQQNAAQKYDKTPFSQAAVKL